LKNIFKNQDINTTLLVFTGYAKLRLKMDRAIRKPRIEYSGVRICHSKRRGRVERIRRRGDGLYLPRSVLQTDGGSSTLGGNG